MQKSSSYNFHFPTKHHSVIFKDGTLLPSFSKTGPKFIRSLEFINLEFGILRSVGRSLKHLKYTYSIKSASNVSCCPSRIVRLLPCCLKTAKYITIRDISDLAKTGSIETRYLGNLKSYSLELICAKALASLRDLRKAETVKILFNRMYGLHAYGDIWEEGKQLKRMGIKNVSVELQKANPSEMMKIAQVIPRSACLHFILDDLSLNFKVNEYDVKLAVKIQSIRLKNITNSSFFSIVQSAKYLKNLTFLHLGESHFEGGLRLNKLTNYSLFPKLAAEFKELRSLKLNFQLTNTFYSEVDVSKFFKKLNLPVELETFSLDIDGILLDETSKGTGQNFCEIFKQIENMKRLRDLKLNFRSRVNTRIACEEFFSLFPRGLLKLENLKIKVGLYPENHCYSLEKAFEWIQSFPNLKHAELSIPLTTMSSFEYDIGKIENLYLNISYENLDYFEGFLAFLAKRSRLRLLRLQIQKSFDAMKTSEILNDYLCKMENLEDFAVTFVDFEGGDCECLSLLRPLAQKVKNFHLMLMDGERIDVGDKLGKIVRKEFADE